MAKYWYARRFPVGNPRNAMAPVSREGRMAFVWFVAAMLAGVVAWGVLALFGIAGMIIGGIVFIAACAGAGWWLIRSVIVHGDQNHTVADYKAGRV